MKLRKRVEEIDQKYHDRKVVVVDDNDQELRIAGLVAAHRDPGIQHRAFSLVLYRKIKGRVELLLQRRSVEKPAFPLFWTNTCCYNMVQGEEYLSRAVSRVKEEMGIVVPRESLKELYKFSYYAPDIEGWCENELDTVIVGEWDGEVKLNPDEAADYKWIEMGVLEKDIERQPEVYTLWFKTIVKDSRFRSFFE